MDGHNRLVLMEHYAETNVLERDGPSAVLANLVFRTYGKYILSGERELR